MFSSLIIAAVVRPPTRDSQPPEQREGDPGNARRHLREPRTRGIGPSSLAGASKG